MPLPVCVFGEVLFDCFPGGREVLGGAPFNVAWHLQGFGLAPVFISRVGNDESGRRVRDAMSNWGMNQCGVQDDPRLATGRVSVSLENGEPSYEIVANSAYDFIASETLSDVRPGFIYHGSLALRNSTSKATLGVLKSRANASIFVDVNLRAPWWRHDSALELLAGANWVKLNREELGLLGDDSTDLLGAARRFRDAHDLDGLVITLGADGAIAVTADQEPVQVSPPDPITKVVDSVGAGDAFASVMILGLRLGWPLATTMERAQGFASELVQQHGATVSDPGLYQSLCRQWESTP